LLPSSGGTRVARTALLLSTQASTPWQAARKPIKPYTIRGFSHCQRGSAVSALPACPQCNSEYTYEDGQLLVCPECAHEWSANAAESFGEDEKLIKDSVGNTLQDGDTITVIKDLKVKGSSLVVKVGTKVKNIRLVDGDHDIDCKIDGIGAMKLKSEFVRKV
jgi:protein PhnA